MSEDAENLTPTAPKVGDEFTVMDEEGDYTTEVVVRLVEPAVNDEGLWLVEGENGVHYAIYWDKYDQTWNDSEV